MIKVKVDSLSKGKICDFGNVNYPTLKDEVFFVSFEP